MIFNMHVHAYIASPANLELGQFTQSSCARWFSVTIFDGIHTTEHTVAAAAAAVCASYQAMVSQWSYSGDVDIPPHIALFGENMAAVHSIAYDGLISPFYLFAGESLNHSLTLATGA